jgi:hypothetical protein
MMISTENVETHTVVLTGLELRLAVVSFAREALDAQDPVLRDRDRQWSGEDGFSVQWAGVPGKSLASLDEESVRITWRSSRNSPLRKVET